MLKAPAFFSEFSVLFFPLIFIGLTGCSTTNQHPEEVTITERLTQSETVSRPESDKKRITDLERRLIARQRTCLEEKRRQEQALKESMRRSEELQRKLDALLEIDRELRNRRKTD